MRIVLDNNITFGENSDYQITKIQGIDSPNIRTGSGLYAGRDLGFVSGQFLGARTIVIEGFYIGDTCNDAQSDRLGLLGALQIRKEYVMSFIGFQQYAYLITGVLTNMKCDYNNRRVGTFQLTFLCVDPIFYQGSSATSTSINDTWTNRGGQAGTFTVPNNGNIDTQIRWTWVGQVTNPTIINVTKGQTWSATTFPSGTVQINFKTHQILSGGRIYNSYLNPNATWFSISPGGDTLQITSTGNTNVEYRRGGRLGI